MATQLLPNEYIPFAPDDPSQIKIQHELCENGKDHKERLYIRRMANGTIKAKCHNCGKAGVYSEPKHVRNLHTLLKKSKQQHLSKGTFELPEDCLVAEDIYKWPVKARAFLYIADLTDKDIADMQICYSPSYNRVIIPCYFNNRLHSWQGRDIEGQEPKYITQVDESISKKPIYIASPDNVRVGFKEIILVEDVLSAKRISLCGYYSAALFGVSADFDQLYRLARDFNKAWVFLDDDNSTVKRQAKQIQDACNNIFQEDGKVIAVGRDPKRHGRKELCKLLENVINAT